MRSDPIVLKVPRCQKCDAPLAARQFYRKTEDGVMVRYTHGETIDHANFIEVTICPRCDRR